MAENSNENKDLPIPHEEGDNLETLIKSVEKNAEIIEKNINSVLQEKSQSLVDVANDTFQELCKTLEVEHNKLINIEERRKVLQEEIQRLKKEIDEEKKACRLVETTITDSLIVDIMNGEPSYEGTEDAFTEHTTTENTTTSNSNTGETNTEDTTNTGDATNSSEAKDSEIDGIETLSRIQKYSIASMPNLDICSKVDVNAEQKSDEEITDLNTSEQTEMIQSQLSVIIDDCIIEQHEDRQNETTDEPEN